MSVSPSPLTTIFTPPSSCRTHWTYSASIDTYNSAYDTFLIQNALPDALDTVCFPSGFTNWGQGNPSQLYSPGHCPIGYNTPYQSVNGPTTTVTCCMVSFSYSSTVLFDDNDVSYTHAGCISTYPAANGTTTVPAVTRESDLILTTVSGPIMMWGQPLQVAFVATDLSLFTTSTSAAASSTPAQPSSNPSTQAAPTATSLPPTYDYGYNTQNGLSTGAKAGIGVGVALVGAFLIGLAFFLLRRRRHRARSEEQHTMINMDEVQGPPESQEKSNSYHDDAKDGLEPAELDHQERPISELDSSARMEMQSLAISPVESREHLSLDVPTHENEQA